MPGSSTTLQNIYFEGTGVEVSFHKKTNLHPADLSTLHLPALMIGPRRAGFSQFGGLAGDVESGSRQRQGMAEARRMAEVRAQLDFLFVDSFFSPGCVYVLCSASKDDKLPRCCKAHLTRVRILGIL